MSEAGPSEMARRIAFLIWRRCGILDRTEFQLAEEFDLELSGVVPTEALQEARRFMRHGQKCAAELPGADETVHCDCGYPAALYWVDKTLRRSGTQLAKEPRIPAETLVAIEALTRVIEKQCGYCAQENAPLIGPNGYWWHRWPGEDCEPCQADVTLLEAIQSLQRAARSEKSR